MPFQQIDCASWSDLLNEVMKATQVFEQTYSASGVPFFRGHSSPNYQLLPGLFRPTATGIYTDYDERNFYYEFRARAGVLLNTGLGSWDVLFLMQHHGVPTRLLDWTESFATALYFALEGATSDADVWMLNPYLLNESEANTPDIIDVESRFESEYFDLYIESPRKAKPPAWNAVAIYPRRQIARLASQHGLFTLHHENVALEGMDQPWLTRFRLSAPAVAEASRFLRVMGVNAFSLFPDLDGLSRFLRKRVRGGYGIVA